MTELLGQFIVLLWLVGQASRNTAYFLVCCSSHQKQEAHFGKKCCHSCDTGLNLESKRVNCFVNFRLIFWE